MEYLALFVVVMLVVILPAALYERWRRTDYRKYVEYQRALAGQREAYVPPTRQAVDRPRPIVKHGIVR